MSDSVRAHDRLHGLGDKERRWLLAVALEERLPKSALVAVMGRLGDDTAKVVPFVTEAVARDLLVHTGLVHSPFPNRPGELREPCYAVPEDARQVVLRSGTARGELESVAAACRAALGERSEAAIELLIQRGDLEGLKRFLALRDKVPSLGRERGITSDDERLRLAVEQDFDAKWLGATFGDRALDLAGVVLSRSLPRLDPCDHVYGWVKELVEQRMERGDEVPAELVGLLAQHAILRNQPETAERLARELPLPLRSAVLAAARYLAGDLAGALEVLRAPLAPIGTRVKSQRFDFTSLRLNPAGSSSAVGQLLPLLALLLCSRGGEQDRAEGKRLLNARGSLDELGGAARAFRALLRAIEQNEGEIERLSAHQVPAQASAWEVLILGLTVLLSHDEETTRAGWMKLLLDRGLAFADAGYAWASRQALFLSEALQQRLFEVEFRELRPGEPPPRCRTSELLLRDLIAPKAEWEKALDALARVADEEDAAEKRGYRVSWIVSVAECELRRPALEEYLPERGWFGRRRVGLEELFEKRDDLPEEDVRVLYCTTEDASQERVFLPEAWEALVGHPRVFDGTRGGNPVNVVAAQCRVRAEEVGGYLHIDIEPSDAELGIQVRATAEDTLAVYRVDQTMWSVMSALPRGLRVPPAQQGRALSLLGKLSQRVEVSSSLLGQERTVEANATPCLRIAPHAGAWIVQAGVRPFGAEGQFFIAGTGRRSLVTFAGGAKLRTDRDFERERVLLSQLIVETPILLEGVLDPDEAPGPGDPPQTWSMGHEGVLTLLSELPRASTPFELEWPESRPLRLTGTVTRADLRISLRRKKGWYLATGGIRIDQVNEVLLGELVRLPSLGGGRFVQLPSGDFVEIEERVRRVMEGLSRLSEPSKGGALLRMHESAFEALRLLEKDPGVDWDSAARQWIEQVDRVNEQEFAIPTALQATLRPYQVEGFQFLARLTELGLGACLADDMGLGKTIQVLTLLLLRAADGPALVVAPTSVCANWQAEVARFAPSVVTRDYSGPHRKRLLDRLGKGSAPEVLVCSYQLLQQDVDALAHVEFGTVVLDEAQFIKNPASQRARAAYRLQARHRIVATGTPVENHLGDVWSLFHFLMPGLFGSHRSYQRRFVAPIQRDDDAATKEQLRRLLRPYVLRRLKSQVLGELPPLTTIRHEVRLSREESIRYALLRRQIHDKLHTGHGKRQNKLEILAEITRLRRFCCHPRLVFPDAPLECSKLDTFQELVDELVDGGHRALVFSQFTDFLGLVREQLDQRNIAYEYLDGSTPRQKRQKSVEAFQAGGTPLFLISLKAGGFGLNLTAADYVIHLDPWWNPAVEAQATDRAHRIGQERRVTVYRLVTKETIEESILALHEDKKKLADALLEGTDAAGIDSAELLALIGPA